MTIHAAIELARRQIVVLPFGPNWRWMLDREDSPWYPTLRLSRQPARGDWQTPMIRIVEELRQCRR
jgi:hypothetical protein